MAYLQRYILSILSAAMICGILLGIAQNSFFHKVMKLLCGLFMTITFLAPVHTFTIPASILPDVSILDEGRMYAKIGTSYTLGESAEVIKQQCEAYILAKAASLEIPLEIEIEVSDSDPPLPVRAILSGTSDSLQRNTISTILKNDLAITKEHQIWMDQS